MIDDTRKLEIGRVFRDTLRVIRGHAGPLVVLTLLLGVLPTVVTTSIQMSALGAGDGGAAASKGLVYMAAVLVSTVLSLLMFASQYHVTIAALEGRRVEAREALRIGASRMVPFFAASLLVGIGVAFGALLLIVPGVILALMWSVALPVIVGETTSVTGALSRSRALTQGNRWRILGLAVLAWIVLLLVTFVVGAVAGVGLLLTPQPTMGALIAAAVTNLVVTLPISVGGAALYVQLRDLKGGGAAVAQVFA